MSVRVVISDVDAGHAATVKTAILAGYGAGLTADEVEIRIEGIANSLAYADSVGAVAVVRSTTGVSGAVSAALTYYPDIQVFMPLGSNSFVELTALTEIPVIVTSGASEGTDNETGYGTSLEFFDDDNGEGGTTDLSSFSNGVIAGKMLKIKDTRGGSWWDARYAARMTASEEEWNKFNGFGIIDVLSAIAYVGTTDDPYLDEEPGEEPEEVLFMSSTKEIRVKKRATSFSIDGNGKMTEKKIVQVEYKCATGERYDTDDFATTETTYTQYNFRG